MSYSRHSAPSFAHRISHVLTQTARLHRFFRLRCRSMPLAPLRNASPLQHLPHYPQMIEVLLTQQTCRLPTLRNASLLQHLPHYPQMIEVLSTQQTCCPTLGNASPLQHLPHYPQMIEVLLTQQTCRLPTLKIMYPLHYLPPLFTFGHPHIHCTRRCLPGSKT
jgi:hypothetical protein